MALMREMGVERVFWGWDRPVLESAVAFLANDGGRFELEETVLVVPTAEAGRRLRRALAEWADERGRAVSVPHVWPPNLALAPMSDKAVAASELEVRLVWARILGTCGLESFRALLPKVPEVVSWKWRWDLAGTLVELQELLGAGGLGMAEVVARAENIPGTEVARWRDLARLERLFDEALKAMGKRCPQRLKRERAERPWVPEGVKRVVVLAAPDLPPLMGRWLEGCAAEGLEVVVTVQASEDSAEGFDGFGRPMEALWGEDAGVDVGLTEAAIRMCRNPVGQAEEVVRWLGEAAGAGMTVAVGVCDAEVTPLLTEKLEVRGLSLFEPGGVAVQSDGLWHLLTLTGELMGTGNWRAFCGLMRIEEVREAWCGSRWDEVVRVMDEFAAEHLPGSLELAKALLEQGETKFSDLNKAVLKALDWRRKLRTGGFLEVAREWLIALYGERGFKAEAPGDRERVQLGWAWLEEVEAVTGTMNGLGLKVGRQEQWELVMERLSSRMLEPVRGEVDLVLQGWLELLWENAPALVVAGLNEENVPGVMLGHPFLPDRFRHQLGLPNQASRFARDAYLLTALGKQRVGAGRLGVTVGRWSANEDVRKPSRLLTLCGEAELVGRVRHLFPEKEAEEVGGAAVKTVPWKLAPRVVEVEVTTISPSRIASYLDCPFRFYLDRGLKMKAVEAVRREMDAMQFGDLVHEVLRYYGEDAEARQWVEVNRIQKWFKERLEEGAKKRFGERLPPLVRLQVDAAEQRLFWHAEVEARERRAGWEIVAAELELGAEGNPAPFLIEGARFTGKVDRVEHHSGSGKRRVIDFKTMDKLTDPIAAHCKAVKQVEAGEEWKTFPSSDGKKWWRWVDVQLPLYAAALRNHPLGPVTEVGYACLPKAVIQTDLMQWKDFDQRWEDAAVASASEVVRRMRAGIFWPPSEGKVRSRDFEALWPGGVQGAVVWSGSGGEVGELGSQSGGD